ncbi:MAG: hypothetical protein ACNA8L_07760 [Luteolibacter sp.]
MKAPISILFWISTISPLFAEPEQRNDAPPCEDTRLVQNLLANDLGNRRFEFSTIVRATSGKEVIPLDHKNEIHKRLLRHIETALAETIREQNREDAPVRELRRINEASRFFEDGLAEKLNAIEDLTCTPAPTVQGVLQRSGYPDLRLVDEASGTVFYLDPKLVQQGSDTSTFRTFYFEPKTDTLKITDDAVHLILGIEHDGKAREWTFVGWRVSCLSKLSVRLKAEFQASNADLYRDSGLSITPENP